MGLFNSLIGRRQFLAASITTAAVLGIGKVTGFLSPVSARGTERGEAKGKKALKGVVVYYSATGSTGKVAGAIYRGMKSVIDCDVAPIKKIDPKKMAEYDVVAIGGPIWYFRETANLRLFVTKMPNMSGKLCVPFCTHGTNPDGFFFSLNQALQRKAFTVIGWDDWYGGCSHVLHQPSPYFTDGHPDEIDLQEAEAFGKAMAERAQRIFAGEKGLIPEIPTGADAESLWVPQGFGESRGMGNAMQGGGMSGGMPGGMPGGESGGGMPAGMPGAGGQGVQAPGAAPVAAGLAAAGGASAAGGAPGGMPGSGMAGGMPGGPGGMPGGMPGGGSGWAAAGGSGEAPRGRPGNANADTMIPTIDLKKCIYPRCRSCMDMCLVDAINLSMISAPGSVEGSSLVVKESCLHCSHPLCEKACEYDAITFDNGSKTEHIFDMKKCIYPKCTLCIDECPMESLDFTQTPTYVKRNCEGCDVCWCVCPEDAISIPNIATTHALLKPSGSEDGFFAALNAAEKAGKFRRLVPLDKIGWDNIVYMNPNAPRVVLKKENYPYEMDK